MWIYTSLSKCRLFASDKYAATLVFVTAVVLRMVPELVAYPYPIGYDVINYYIPVVAQFEQHWPVTASQFPLYVIILHFVNLATGLSAHSIVAAMAIVMFGVFGMSLYFLARSLLKLDIDQSIFLAAFVIFQMAVLRTAWDLHKDIFAITSMMFAFSLIGRRTAGWKGIAPIVVLTALTVASDRMIGMLFCISLAASALAMRNRTNALYAAISSSLFAILMIASNIANGGTTIIDAAASEKTPSYYNPENLLILFAVVNGLLLPAGVIGFVHTKNAMLLKVPLIVSLVASFSWLGFADNSVLVADRWTVLAGIFVSVFASYGILHMVRKLKLRLAITGSVLAAFAAIGLAYAAMPHDSPFILYGIARSSIEKFVPATMQFNSLNIDDNTKLLSTIAWINKNTESDAVIVGEKHWRGFMDVYLKDQRTYRPSSLPYPPAKDFHKQGQSVYWIQIDNNSPAMFVVLKQQ